MTIAAITKKVGELERRILKLEQWVTSGNPVRLHGDAWNNTAGSISKKTAEGMLRSVERGRREWGNT